MMNMCENANNEMANMWESASNQMINMWENGILDLSIHQEVEISQAKVAETWEICGGVVIRKRKNSYGSFRETVQAIPLPYMISGGQLKCFDYCCGCCGGICSRLMLLKALDRKSVV